MDLDPALQTFIAESRELLAGMEDALLELERSPGDTEAIAAIFRAMHTIKGSAGLFGLDAMVAFAHAAETVLDRVRSGELAVDGPLAALLLECGDHLGQCVAELAGEGDEGGEDSAEARANQGRALIERLGAYLPAAAAPTASATRPAPVPADAAEAGAWHLSLRFGPNVLRDGLDPAAFLRYLGTLGDFLRVQTLWDAMPAAAEMDPECCYLGFEIDFCSSADRATIEGVFEFVRDDCTLELARAPCRPAEAPCPADARRPAPAAAKAKGHDKRGGDASHLRVDAAKLDELIDQVGELVIAGAAANLIAKRSQDGDLLEAMSLMARLVEEIRDRALSLRMVEIGETFHRFQRVVRDVSKELGKEIELVISGADTELDKSLVEKIGDPLLHLVRNAIDHGIEPVELRVARGKPAAGRLSLAARHESGSIVIEVADDGGGLDRDRILAKARERGLVAPEQNLSDQETMQLIFEAGFSTAAQVTNLSGRGVGMDVVKKNIALLRGSVELASREGAGTTVRIRLPLTLAIIDGFLVEVGGAAFVVPLETVQECLELPKSGPPANGRNYLNLRGEVLPFVRLRDFFDIEGEAPARENAVVINALGRKIGIVVDLLQGELQTVIKPLGSLFRHLRGISGSTILGSGEVALILDVQTLASLAADAEERALAPAAAHA